MPKKTIKNDFALVTRDVISKYWAHFIMIILAVGVAMSGFVISCPGKGTIEKKSINIIEGAK